MGSADHGGSALPSEKQLDLLRSMLARWCEVGHVAVLQRESTLAEENSQCVVLIDGVAGGHRAAGVVERGPFGGGVLICHPVDRDEGSAAGSGGNQVIPAVTSGDTLEVSEARRGGVCKISQVGELARFGVVIDKEGRADAIVACATCNRVGFAVAAVLPDAVCGGAGRCGSCVGRGKDRPRLTRDVVNKGVSGI